jgi:hypothetical protein
MGREPDQEPRFSGGKGSTYAAPVVRPASKGLLTIEHMVSETNPWAKPRKLAYQNLNIASNSILQHYRDIAEHYSFSRRWYFKNTSSIYDTWRIRLLRTLVFAHLLLFCFCFIERTPTN